MKIITLAIIIVFTLQSCSTTPSFGINKPTKVSGQVMKLNNTSKPAPNNKFNSISCESLAAWVKPLQRTATKNRQGKLRSTRIYNTHQAFEEYKFLFEDENFIPFFGDSFDKLGEWSLSRAYRWIENSATKCRKRTEPDIQFYLGLNPRIYLVHAFSDAGGRGPEMRLKHMAEYVKKARLTSNVVAESTKNIGVVEAKHGIDRNKQNSTTAYNLTAPSKEILASLDERYQWMQKEFNQGASVGFDYYNCMKMLSELNYSRDEMIAFGLWYLKNAKHPLEYERAALFILSVIDKAPEYKVVEGRTFKEDVSHKHRRNSVLEAAARGDVVIEKSRFPLDNSINLLGGKAASVAANYYANKKNPEHSLERAYSLHKMAGDTGVQKSLLVASYLVQTKELKTNFFAKGGSEAVHRSVVAYHFERAMYACNRESAVFTKADCNEAEQQYDLAEKRSSELDWVWDRRQGWARRQDSKPVKLTTTQVGVMALIGITVVAILAKSGSGKGSQSDFKAKQEEFERDQAKRRQETDDLAHLWWAQTAGMF